MPLERLRRVVARLAGVQAPPKVRRRTRKPKRPRDFQRARVYRWEAAHVFLQMVY